MNSRKLKYLWSIIDFLPRNDHASEQFHLSIFGIALNLIIRKSSDKGDIEDLILKPNYNTN